MLQWSGSDLYKLFTAVVFSLLQCSGWDLLKFCYYCRLFFAAVIRIWPLKIVYSCRLFFVAVLRTWPFTIFYNCRLFFVALLRTWPFTSFYNCRLFFLQRSGSDQPDSGCGERGGGQVCLPSTGKSYVQLFFKHPWNHFEKTIFYLIFHNKFSVEKNTF